MDFPKQLRCWVHSALRAPAAVSDVRVMMRVFVAILLLLIFPPLAKAAEQTAPIEIGGVKICPNGYRLDVDTCNRIAVPQNAVAIGSDWICVPGYKKDGNLCVQYEVPENAIPTLGGGWICKVGYTQSQTSCIHTQSQTSCIQKSWAELNDTAEFLMNRSVRVQQACEKVCDVNYYGDREEECNKFCKGEIKHFPR